MSTKNCIRTVVAVAILAWPGVETYRYFVATRQAAAALERQEGVELKLAQLKNARLAREKKAVETTPVQNPVSSRTATPSTL